MDTLEKYEWSCPEWKGITSRYEHSAFIPECNPKKVYVFGGAQQATNLNDVQVLDLGKVNISFGVVMYVTAFTMHL